MAKENASAFTYVTFIRTTPEKLWNALIDPEFQRQYWFGVHFETEWKQGASWKMIYADGRITDTGEVLEFEPPKKLVLRWRNEFRPELREEGYSRCTIDLEPVGNAVKLRIVHTMDKPESQFVHAVSEGWPQIMSNLKSLLETGEICVKR
ncbi:MAG: SRPBCC family protein [Burkholderiaceae bacterium]|nr:SRPBCC family protein [Burkholderiaceae bacterium]